MSKKRFSAGLDDLFDDSPIEQVQMGGSVFNSTAAARPNAVSDAPVVERKSHGKNFVMDLDALLQEAMDESFAKFDNSYQGASPASSGKTKSTSNAGPAPRQALSGLDSLIRQTVDVQDFSYDEVTGKKRLTVAVDRSKLDQLKTIARMENSFMKDILVSLIDEYIVKYQEQKGLGT